MSKASTRKDKCALGRRRVLIVYAVAQKESKYRRYACLSKGQKIKREWSAKAENVLNAPKESG
jgi:hypothetical protein